MRDSQNRFWYLDDLLHGKPNEERVLVLKSMINGALVNMASPVGRSDADLSEIALKETMDAANRVLLGYVGPLWTAFDKRVRDFEKREADRNALWEIQRPQIESVAIAKALEQRIAELERDLKAEKAASQRLQRQVAALRSELATDKWLAGKE